MFDITSEPVRKMHSQTVRQFTYLMSAFDKGGTTSNRIRYDKLEMALLDFLPKQDWIAIAGETESDEYKAAKVGLEAVLRQLDIATRRLESLNQQMDQASDSATVASYMKRIARDESLLATFTQQKDALQATVDAAQAKCGVLSKPEDLLDLMDQSDRMKLRAEIQKRVSRIDLIFLPSKQGFLAIIVFSNGACRGITNIRAGMAQIKVTLMGLTMRR